MLHVVRLGVYDPRHQQHSVGQGAVAVHPVLVAVARVGHFHHQRAHVGLVENVNNLLQGHVVDVGALAVAPAYVQPHLVAADVSQGMVYGPYVQGYYFLEGRQGLILVGNMPLHGQVRAVQLQGKAVGCDYFVLLAQFFGQGENVLLVAFIVLVAQGQGDDARGCGGHKQVFGLLPGSFDGVEKLAALRLHQVRPLIGHRASAGGDALGQLNPAGSHHAGILVLVPVAAPLPGTAKARHPLGHVGRKADPGLLPIVNYVHRGGQLRGHNASGGFRGGSVQGGPVHRFSPGYLGQHIHQPLGPGQAAGVGGQDARFALLHGIP